MKAVVYRRYGGPDRLALEARPLSEPGAGQMRVRVHAASVNPIDWKLASGAYRWLLPVRFPATPGFDVCGTVEAVHPSVSEFRPGQRIHARLLGREGGACATHAVVDAAVAAVVPEEMSDAAAAGLPLAGLTALQALRDVAGLPVGSGEASGQRVLVVGAAGGVGHLAVQIAVAAGAQVAAYCSAGNASFVASLGAHEVLDRQTTDWNALRGRFDVVLDAATAEWRAWRSALAPRGRYVSCLPAPGLMVRSLFNRWTHRRAGAVMMRSDRADLRWLDGLVSAGRLRVHIAETFPLDALDQAWRRSMTGRTAGKLIVRPSLTD